MKIALYGTGKCAYTTIVKLYGQGLSPAHIYDSDKNKQGTQIFGFEVQSPETLRNNPNGILIIIAVIKQQFINEITDNLLKLGFTNGKDFMTSNEFFGESIEGYLDTWGRNSGLPVSFTDEWGNVFTRTRGVNNARILISKKSKIVLRVCKNSYKVIMEDVVLKLQSSGLLGKEIVGTYFDNRKFVDNPIELKDSLLLKHDFQSPLIFGYEFSQFMFFNSAKFIINLTKKLDRLGLGIVDVSYANIIFSHGEFMLLDFGGITNYKTPFNVFEQFLSGYVIPLLLMNYGQSDKAYMYLRVSQPKVTFNDIKGYMSETQVKQFTTMCEHCKQFINIGDVSSFCDTLLEYISNISILPKELSPNGAQLNLIDNFNKKENWEEKARIIYDWTTNLKIKTCCDLTANLGFYALMLAEKLDYVVAGDFINDFIDDLFIRIKKFKIKNVYPVYMNFIAPTLPKHRALSIDGNNIKAWIEGGGADSDAT
ncbi:hypothetical protein AGMMS49938_17700 [Fibrobacterales bacterium]|nr:hypothetical protein AGMMS49938_17700 [Fibrobacterales bacterium]